MPLARRLARPVCCLLVLLAGAPIAAAQSANPKPRTDALEADLQRLEQAIDDLRAAQPASRRAEVERQQGIFAREVARLREAIVLPDDTTLDGQFGLAPAASKVYRARGLSIGGYGELVAHVSVANSANDEEVIDLARFVLYTGFKFADWIVFNSEIEIEHATSAATASAGNGAVAVELASLDLLLHRAANLRAGLLLVPMGFINEVHEPPFFHGTLRPPVETAILPSTWRANAVGLFGEPLPGIEYRTFAVTSFNAKGFRPDGLRTGKQSGNRELAEDWSWVLRLDANAANGTTLGGSLYLGDQGQDRAYGNDEDGYFAADVFTQIYEVHAEVRRYGFEFRALGAFVHIDDADVLNTDPDLLGYDPSLPQPADETPPPGGVAKRMHGYYGELAYDVLPLLLPSTTHYLAPWVRYSRYDTQASVPGPVAADERLDRTSVELGLTYKPIPQAVVKLDFALQDAERGSVPDELRFGVGFVF